MVTGEEPEAADETLILDVVAHRFVEPICEFIEIADGSSKKEEII